MSTELIIHPHFPKLHLLSFKNMYLKLNEKIDIKYLPAVEIAYDDERHFKNQTE